MSQVDHEEVIAAVQQGVAVLLDAHRAGTLGLEDIEGAAVDMISAAVDALVPTAGVDPYDGKTERADRIEARAARVEARKV